MRSNLLLAGLLGLMAGFAYGEARTASATSDDENARLRPDPPAEWKAGTNRLQVRFDPYAIHFWSLE